MEIDIKQMFREILEAKVAEALGEAQITAPASYTTAPAKPAPPDKPALPIKQVPLHGTRRSDSFLSESSAIEILEKAEAGHKLTRLAKAYRIGMTTLNRILAREGRYSWLLEDYDKRTGKSRETTRALLVKQGNTPRTVLDMETAAYVLDDVRAGMAYSDIMQKYNVSGLTVSRIVAGMDRYAVLHGEKGRPSL